MRQASRSQKKDEEDVGKYYQHFLILSKPLLQSQCLTEDEQDRAFWSDFHLEDQKLLLPRLIAMYPYHPSGCPFPYKNILKAACMVFQSGMFSFLNQEFWELSTSAQAHLPLADAPLQQPSAPPKSVRFAETTHEQEDRELDDLMLQLHSTHPVEPLYMSLYVCCMLCFPSLLSMFPKPQYSHQSSYMAQSTVPSPALSTPRPLRQPWPLRLPASALLLAQMTTPMSADLFFQPQRCFFCNLPEHIVCKCHKSEEYVCSGHTTIINYHVCLPNGEQVPNDRTGLGVQHSLNAWLTANPISAQQSVQREAPPHSALSLEVIKPNPPPKSFVEEVSDKEARTSSDKSSGLELLQVLAAERHQT